MFAGAAFNFMHKLVFLFLLIGQAVVLANSFDQQVQFWEKRIARDPDDYLSPTRLGELLLKHARETGDLSANADAEKNFRLALKRNPEHYPAIVLLASACIAQHKFSDAFSRAEEAVKLKPDDAFSQTVLGDVCLELGKTPRAEEAYKKSLQLTPALATHSRMAYLFWIKGDVAASLQSYEAALEAGENGNASPANLAWCHLQKGEFHFRTGDFQKTQAEYAAAAKILPDNYSVLEHLAELRAAQSQYDEAIALYQKVIVQTSRPEYMQALGDVFEFYRKSPEAKTWHEKALAGYLQAATNGTPHYYHHLASFYCDSQTNAVEALKWARKDIEIRQNVFACDTLAWALYRNGKWDEAFEAAQKALAFGTKDSHMLLHASSIFSEAGKKKEAAGLIRQAMEINPRYNSFHAHR